MPGKQRKNKPFDDPAAQLAAARIIAADPLHYPGVMQEWAKLVLQKQNNAPIWSVKPRSVPYAGR